MRTKKRKSVKKGLSLKVPKIFTKNPSMKPLKLQPKVTIGHPDRYPLGRYRQPIVISHGSTSDTCKAAARLAVERGGIVLNDPTKIGNASNKVKTKKLMLANGVPTTPYMLATDCLYNDRFEIKRMTLNYPIVAKTKYGFGGKGMTLIKSPDELKEWRKGLTLDRLKLYFFEECFNWNGSLEKHMKTTREYRVGVSPLLAGKKCDYTWTTEEGTHNFSSDKGVIVELRKLMKKEGVQAGEFGRNLALGHSYFTRTFKKNYRLEKRGLSMDWDGAGIKACVDAVRACGLDYGAVDLLWSSTTGEFSVIEINTAPSMGKIDEGHSFTLGQWQQGFKYMIEAKLK